MKVALHVFSIWLGFSCFVVMFASIFGNIAAGEPWKAVGRLGRCMNLPKRHGSLNR